ncbi:MAG: WecB/TagA/CpsF family glycosyltransferase [Methylococcaceae bacterium]|nr:WecB/TagA/CpsF family glycosyltransferase [Methylococcaceae bacterium]
MDLDKDFSRNSWCLLGLPFDAVDMNQTAIEILSAANENRPCFLSTPNLNFLCGTQKDKAFRESVIDSDLSIVDGFPIVVTAKLLGIPIPERVAGSNLVEFLYRRKTDVPLKVYFFGGEPGVAEKAHRAVNENPSGLFSVGYHTPGFGSIEDMSTPDIIETINKHDIEFLIVAISAKKGQAWIELNRHKLKAPVVSHLGAVINFFAGTVKRAPETVQRIGLEWLWRIYQEPSLWKRYYDDGLQFLKLLVCNVLPYWLWLKFNSENSTDQPVSIQTSINSENRYEMKLSGDCSHLTMMPLRTEFKKAAESERDVIIDLSHVNLIDSAFLGLSLILYKHLKTSGHSLKFANFNKTVSRILKWQKVNDLFI